MAGHTACATASRASQVSGANTGRDAWSAAGAAYKIFQRSPRQGYVTGLTTPFFLIKLFEGSNSMFRSFGVGFT